MQMKESNFIKKYGNNQKYFFLVFSFLQQCTKLNSLNERFTTLQSQQQQTKPPIIRPKPAQYNIPKPDLDVPIIPDRPRLKDYLAAMKPETWGTTANRSSTKVEENIYKPSPVSNISSNSSFYNTNTMPTSAPVYSNIPEQTFTSLPNFNPQHLYQVQSPIHSEQSSMAYVPQPPAQVSSPFPAQHPMPYQTHSFDQNFSNQSQMLYNSPPPPSTHSFPQQQQQFYTSQSFQPQQSIYQPTSQTIPTQHSGLQQPSIYQYQNFSDPNRPIQQSLPPLPTKFDPYRPQPVGAYDIPKTQPPPLMNPQDVYRPGGLLGMNQTQIPSSTINNNNYDQNQFVQYIPSSFANLSINSMANH